MSEFPKTVITVSALLVKSELSEEDQGDPRVIEARISDEADGLVVLTNKTRDGQTIAFFTEQWRGIRRAVDTLCAAHDADLLAATEDQPPNTGNKPTREAGSA